MDRLTTLVCLLSNIKFSTLTYARNCIPKIYFDFRKFHVQKNLAIFAILRMTPQSAKLNGGEKIPLADSRKLIPKKNQSNQIPLKHAKFHEKPGQGIF